MFEYPIIGVDTSNLPEYPDLKVPESHQNAFDQDYEVDQATISKSSKDIIYTISKMALRVKRFQVDKDPGLQERLSVGKLALEEETFFFGIK